MTALADQLVRRVSAAEVRAEAIAAKAAQSGKVADEVEFEQALDDLQRYSSLADRFTRVRVKEEPRTYRPDLRHSFFADVFAAESNREARDRLDRHRRENEVERRDITSSTLNGLVPPQYAVDIATPLARTGRPLLDLCTPIPMPDSGMEIILGRTTTGTTAASQTAQNTALSGTDAASTALTLPVRMVGGTTTVSRAVFDRAGPAADVLVMVDLLEAAYTSLDSDALNADGTNGTVLGIRNVASIGAVTYTDATPTGLELIPKLGAALTTASAGRKRPATHLIMHSRRWHWLTTRAEAAPLAPISAVPPPDAHPNEVGIIAGARVLLDDNIPTDVSTDQDVVIACRPVDFLLSEGPFSVNIGEIVSTSAGVRISGHFYAAFTAGRYPGGICTLGGSGLNAVAS